MENKVAIFLFGSKSTPIIEEVRRLKKSYKANEVLIHQVIESPTSLNILNLEELLSDKGIDLVNMNVDLITDQAELIISAFRIYHHHFQSFIYMYNPKSERPTDEEPVIIQQLLKQWTGIEQEHLECKIFVNINEINYKDIFFKMGDSFEYLTSLEQFKITREVKHQEIVNKCYWLDKEDNIFIDFESDDTQNINLFTSKKPLLERFEYVEDMRVAALFYSYHLAENGIGDFIETIRQLNNIFDAQSFNDFEKILIEEIDKGHFKTTIKTILYIILFSYDKELHELVYIKIIRYIYTNQLDWCYWKSIVVMFFALKFGGSFKIGDDVYRTTKEVNIAIAEIIEKQSKPLIPPKRDSYSKKVVILIDQILSLHHSPTNVLKVQLEHLLNETDYEYHIIVEENMIQPKEEYVTGYRKYVGNESTYAIRKFKEYFDSERVRFYLVSKDSTIIPRVNTVLSKVFEINPLLIFSLSYYSTAQNILYNHYPIVNFSFGHEYLPAKAHLYLYKNDKRAKELAKKFKDNVLIDYYVQPPILIPRTQSYTRGDLGYTDKDIIIFTTGNRINHEITDVLIEKMQKVLESNTNLKWLLVGAKIPETMEKMYSKMMLKNQIKHIPYEKDLIALIELCDISINPNRIGGGYGVANCIAYGVPVLMCNFESDSLVFVGAENTCGNTYDELIEVLLVCLKNEAFKEELLAKQQKQVADVGIKNETYRLLEYFNETVKNFEQKSTKDK